MEPEPSSAVAAPSDVASAASASVTSSGDETKLEHCWTFWFDEAPPKGIDCSAFQNSMQELGTFSSIQDFWNQYQHAITKMTNADRSNLRLFKQGIHPVWEDPANCKGGKWVIPCNKLISFKVWFDMVLILIGEQLEGSEHLCGVVLSLRPNLDTIGIWTGTTDEAHVQSVTENLRNLLGLTSTDIIEYSEHGKLSPFLMAKLAAKAQKRAAAAGGVAKDGRKNRKNRNRTKKNQAASPPPGDGALSHPHQVQYGGGSGATPASSPPPTPSPPPKGPFVHHQHHHHPTSSPTAITSSSSSQPQWSDTTGVSPPAAASAAWAAPPLNINSSNTSSQNAQSRAAATTTSTATSSSAGSGLNTKACEFQPLSASPFPLPSPPTVLGGTAALHPSPTHDHQQQFPQQQQQQQQQHQHHGRNSHHARKTQKPSFQFVPKSKPQTPS
eukprot:gnl/Spiro4/24960_TR12410_c0_g1_i1.p1 gnl/Spiro4/24960_TR12410_c0_g1~~gnl/Spiro4/24960_TR12410_c0_g1_i1.p1  ORF type:complete len:494 (+),score=153.26 gnl/Spiro4/24960_TR12410_c0_g1_i1:161-1483(+)